MKKRSTLITSIPHFTNHNYYYFTHRIMTLWVRKLFYLMVLVDFPSDVMVITNPFVSELTFKPLRL